jgi:cytochrome c
LQKEDGYDQRRHACKLDREVINSLRQSTNGVLVNSHGRMRGLLLGAGIFAIAPGYAQDVASGEKIFVQCKACHQIGENAKNAVGPVLNGLFGRKAGTIEGYSYSSANKNSGITWDEASFREYIKNPQAKIPGTKMTFPGLKDPKQIDDIVAYLKQFDSTGKRAGIVSGGRKFAKLR